MPRRRRGKGRRTRTAVARARRHRRVTAADGSIEPIEIQVEMERSFLEYSMSVIVARALPDVRDGLKPVHRRILYSMFDNGLRPDRPHNKCAKVVGEVMGASTPTATRRSTTRWPAWCRRFSLRYPLIDGHGNFGGRAPTRGRGDALHGVPAGAARARAHGGIDEETVDMVANYDGSASEPVVLPRGSRTCSSTGPRASPSAWRPTCRPTTWAR